MFSFSYKSKEKPNDIIEIARSYSQKVNLGNYEMADFFCSMKAECTEDQEDTVGKKLLNRCVAHVERDIDEFKFNKENQTSTK